MGATKASGNVVQSTSSISRVVRAGKKKTNTVSANNRKLVLVCHDTKKSVGVLIRNNVTKTLAKPKETAVLIPSPYRFPLPRTQSLALVARVVGLCFVVTGAIFSFVTVSEESRIALEMSALQQATLVDSMPATNNPGVTSPDGARIAPLSVPLISVDGQGETVTGRIPILIQSEAEHVEILAVNSAGLRIKLGPASRVDTMRFRLQWNTTSFESDSYRIEAIAVRGSESQIGRLDKPVIVLHPMQDVEGDKDESDAELEHNQTPTTQNTAPAAAAGSGAVPPSQTVVTSPELVLPSITLSAPEGELRGMVPLRIKARGVEQLRITAHNRETGALYHAGTAQFSGADDLWNVSWNTTHVVNGSYRLIARAVVAGTEIQSAPVAVEVRNLTATPPAPLAPIATTSAPLNTTPLAPQVKLSLSKQNPLAEFVEINLSVGEAELVEIYRTSSLSLSPFFLGQARRIDGDRWRYVWNTTETPNGDYVLFARIRSEYGTRDSVTTSVTVRNVILNSFTPEQAREIETLTTIDAELMRPVTEKADAEVAAIELNRVYVQPVEVFVATLDEAHLETVDVPELLNRFRKELDVLLIELAQALRADDAVAIEEVRIQVEDLKQSILDSIPQSSHRNDLVDSIEQYLDEIVQVLDELTVRNNRLLKERVGVAILNDSDKDGIADYDELNLYQTNPFSADTDGDSFIDSVEITKGFNPHDPRGESLIAYESPKETGVVRDDLLEVKNVSTIVFERSYSVTETHALFTGRGLPNSFVTLYIYSTPIIVTVKTDAEGNWNYILDKDLEDGEHKIYVGITDNEGRIVARSNPLPFVKTAEAYTGLVTNAASVVPADVSPSMMRAPTLIAATSVTIVLLGLTLMLLGMYARRREHEPVLAPSA
jgi:hypothetical protein